jgi:hypothetical protein
MIEGLVATICRLNPFCRTIPSVIPVTAGTIAAPAIEVAICEAATAQKSCHIKMMEEAATTATPGKMTHARFRCEASMSAPLAWSPFILAIFPIVIAVPIMPVAQPRSSKNTLTNGPIPDCMSAMKKLMASNGHRRNTLLPCCRGRFSQSSGVPKRAPPSPSCYDKGRAGRLVRDARNKSRGQAGLVRDAGPARWFRLRRGSLIIFR